MTGGFADVGRGRPQPSIGARLLLLVLYMYRLTALVRRARCRFLPTCSAYALEAVERHGAIRGSAMAVRRIARCHPWNPGGVDPVEP